MSRRFPRAKWVLPDVIDPPEHLCFQIEVPRERFHIAAFRGALLNLASAIFWQDDPDHTAKDVALVWREIVNNVTVCVNTDTNSGIFLEDLMSQQIRISPDDPCIIQMWCIDHWEDWYDPRSCTATTIEQPTNGGDLNPGECREWDVSLRGNDRWLLPAVVNDGDVLTTTNATGAWSDGTLGWNCVNGFTFGFGACVSTDPPEGGDPLQSVDHMRLIMSVDGTWYDAYNTLIAIPGGVSDGQVYFQANDSDLADNSGTVSFHVKLCRFEPLPAVINITYLVGSGPSEIGLNQPFTVTFTNEGGDNGLAMRFDQCVLIEVISYAYWDTGSTPDNDGITRINCDMTTTTLACDPNCVPTDIPTNVCCKGYNFGTDPGSPLTTVTLKITEICP